MRKACYFLFLLLVSQPCAGHGFSGSGLLHPLTGLDHALAMLAVGAWSAQLGGRALYIVPGCFMSMMLLGGGRYQLRRFRRTILGTCRCTFGHPTGISYRHRPMDYGASCCFGRGAVWVEPRFSSWPGDGPDASPYSLHSWLSHYYTGSSYHRCGWKCTPLRGHQWPYAPAIRWYGGNLDWIVVTNK